MVFLWTALYVCAILFANLTLNNFIPLPVFGLLSVGTLFFGAVFTLRDRLHNFGLKAVYRAIALALLVNAYVGWLMMSSQPNWLQSLILNSGLSNWLPVQATEDRFRFIVASFIAILISELTDTMVFQKLMQKSWLTRALSSNAISIPLDTILFTLMAFYGSLSWNEMSQIIFADLIFKALISTLIAFAIYFGFKSPKKIYV
ncbi:MAG: hypothetical protein H6R05_1429 [Burkholderiaceae bacterium]|nr:hypothetical protein [Burkholderiaceae bacterium]